ncbi:MAG TPA: peroxidase-related enzyme [Candidatus Polarisedimenticolia bacterium]|nr:peroxidase-related enzyme [Candidatus Polarisedimenticolia bacterium]
MTYLRLKPEHHVEHPRFQDIQRDYGFVPNFYRAQTMNPALLEAQIGWVFALLVQEGALNRKQKEYIFLVSSAANLSTYCVTAHCEIIRMLGITGPEPEDLAVNHRDSDLPEAEKDLLDFCRKLTLKQGEVVEKDVEKLRAAGWTEPQILEAVQMVGLAKWANCVAFGLGTMPDFENPRIDFPGGVKRTPAAR